MPSDVRSWCSGARPAEASGSVGGIALLACTCSHLAAVRGNVEGADPACHSASPAGLSRTVVGLLPHRDPSLRPSPPQQTTKMSHPSPVRDGGLQGQVKVGAWHTGSQLL